MVDCLTGLRGHFRLSSAAGAFELPREADQAEMVQVFHLIGGLCELITEMRCLFGHFLAGEVVSASRDLAAKAVEIKLDGPRFEPFDWIDV